MLYWVRHWLRKENDISLFAPSVVLDVEWEEITSVEVDIGDDVVANVVDSRPEPSPP